MSRGPGKVQRALLDFLAAHPDREHDLGTLTMIAFDFDWDCFDDPTPAQTESTRRALKRLMDDGRVQRRPQFFNTGLPIPGSTEGRVEWVYRLSVGDVMEEPNA
jgi:hypothetical protein